MISDGAWEGPRPSRPGADRRILATALETNPLSVAFDTLKFARALQGKAKLSAEQAEGIAEAFADATGEQLATKADLNSLGEKLAAATTAGMTVILVRIDTLEAATKAEFTALRAETQAEFAAVRSETQAEFAAVRAETKSEFAAVRAETKSEFAAVRTETKSEFAAVRTEIKSEFTAVKADRDAALAPIRAEQLFTRWMVGFNLAMTVAVLFVLLRR